MSYLLSLFFVVGGFLLVHSVDWALECVTDSAAIVLGFGTGFFITGFQQLCSLIGARISSYMGAYNEFFTF